MPIKSDAKIQELVNAPIMSLGEWSIQRRACSVATGVYWHLICNGCGTVHWNYETEDEGIKACKGCDKPIPDSVAGFLVICRSTADRVTP